MRASGTAGSTEVKGPGPCERQPLPMQIRQASVAPRGPATGPRPDPSSANFPRHSSERARWPGWAGLGLACTGHYYSLHVLY